MVVEGGDKAADYAWKTLRDTLIYTVNRIPEIADDVVNVDNAKMTLSGIRRLKK